MENPRPLEITVISAKDLKDVNVFFKMDVYAVVTIAGDPFTKQRTPVDKGCGRNPTWNFPMKFTIDESSAKQNRLFLIFELREEGILGDLDIGEVHVPIKELLDRVGDAKSTQFVSYQVRKPTGKAKGVLHFSYKFGERVTGAAYTQKMGEPVTAHPGTGMAYPTSGGYPPPTGPYQSAGYPPAGYPPMVSYGYHGGYPPQPGHGYPTVHTPPRKKNLEMELGITNTNVNGAGLNLSQPLLN